MYSFKLTQNESIGPYSNYTSTYNALFLRKNMRPDYGLS